MGYSKCDNEGLEPLLDKLERIHVVQSMDISRRGSVAHILIGVIVEPDKALTTQIATVLGRFSFSLKQVRQNVIPVG